MMLHRLKRVFRPRLETLENRQVLSGGCNNANVLIAEANGVLSVRGTNCDDTIVVTDNGADAIGNITIQTKNGQYVSTTAVTRVVVDARGGDDQLAYRLTGSMEADRFIRFLLGNGDDNLEAAINGNMTDDNGLEFRAGGQDGDDTINVGYTGIVSTDGELFVALYGGDDDDTINFLSNGAVSGLLGVLANGVDDEDKVAVNINLAPGSDGGVVANVDGGKDDDTVALAIRKADDADPTVIVALLNGGSGKNRGLFTPNVPVINCKKLTVLA